MLKMILLGVSVSIDAWAVGGAYRSADIRIPWLTKAIVAMISAMVSLAAICLGNGLERYVGAVYIQIAGGILLIVLGTKTIWEVYTKQEEKNYDRDKSKTIEPIEGIALGGVLASDAFCAGLSMSTMGQMGYIFPIVVGALTYVFLMFADRKIRYLGKSEYFAGIALFALGGIQTIGVVAEML